MCAVRARIRIWAFLTFSANNRCHNSNWFRRKLNKYKLRINFACTSLPLPSPLLLFIYVAAKCSISFRCALHFVREITLQYSILNTQYSILHSPLVISIRFDFRRLQIYCLPGKNAECNAPHSAHPNMTEWFWQPIVVTTTIAKRESLN